MSELFPEWPLVWQRIRNGYGELCEVLQSAVDERNELLSRGYGDPLDGFAATALMAAQYELQQLQKAVEAHDASQLLAVMERTLQSSRYYAEADLSWSVSWESYQPSSAAWKRDIERFWALGRDDPGQMIDYTTRRWTL